MITRTGPEKFLQLEYPLIDVRSPSEFHSGHIPGAVNIALLADDERAEVGTLYHRQGRDQAILRGFQAALPKAGDFLEAMKNLCSPGDIRMYCWRGGMRSELMAKLFSQSGYRISLLEGGYKAYRTFIRQDFCRPALLMVLGGYTGSGKTDILKVLAQKGEQVIDLESLACHKGSVFGALGQPVQPTNEQFENDLYRIWAGMDFSRRIWLEDESRSIGRVALPPPVFDLISGSPLVEVRPDKEFRIKRLVEEYAGFDKALLSEALFRIREGLGGTRHRQALAALESGEFAAVAEISLDYYDKAYRKAIEKRTCRTIFPLDLTGDDPETHASQILEYLSGQEIAEKTA